MLKKSVGLFAFAAIASLATGSLQAAPVYYSNSAVFQGQLGASVTDNYSNPGYSFLNSNAAMSAVLGETDYQSTGHSNINIVSSGRYCAGCNGSFLMSFTTTSVGDANGVFGVGMDIVFNNGYFAYITFGDNSVANVALAATGFWGVTATEEIKSIHFGLSGGAATTRSSFQVDNLTIGSQGQQVPEPASLGLLGIGLAGLGFASRKKS